MDINKLKQRLLARSRQFGPALAIALLAGGIGIYTHGGTFASTFAANGEAEEGVIAGNAGAGDVTGASNDAAVKFGTPATPPSSGNCALPKYPAPGCTGVPAGTALQDLPLNDGGEGYRVTANGTVIDGKRIRGYLLITANNVTVKNSQIDNIVINEYSNVQYTGTMITDTTIGPESGCIVSPGIQNAEYSAIRVRLRGTDDGFRAGGNNVTVKDSYVKNCGSASSHGDGIQDYPFVRNLVFEHNTMDLCGEWTTVPTSNSQCNVPGHNSPVFVHSSVALGNGSSNVTIKDNLALGGVASYYLDPTPQGPWNITGNRAVNNTWDFSAYEAEGHCANVTTWSDNRVVTINANYEVTSTVRTVPCGGN